MTVNYVLFVCYSCKVYEVQMSAQAVNILSTNESASSSEQEDGVPKLNLLMSEIFF